VNVKAETVVARPREEVAAYATDWRNDPEWIGGISEAQQVSGGEFGVGSQVARVASFLGKRIEYVNEVTELEPGRRLAMRSVKGPFPMTVVYEFEDAEGGTLVRVRVGGDASGFYRAAGAVMSRQVKRSITGDVERLKRILER
jgi:uncharacterized membrane protein